MTNKPCKKRYLFCSDVINVSKCIYILHLDIYFSVVGALAFESWPKPCLDTRSWPSMFVSLGGKVMARTIRLAC